MRIAFVSTYPPIECGIATYTGFLVEALDKDTPNELHVVSQRGAEGRHVYPVYETTDSGIAKRIFDTAVKVTPDLVHIQHEFGLFGEIYGVAVMELIFRLKVSGLPVIATFHTVHPEPTHAMRHIQTAMCRELDAVIVHEKEHVSLLRDIYGAATDKIHLIPHGARQDMDIPDAKKKLDLEGKKIILLAGYFRPTKCFDKVVDLFPRILEQVPDAFLVLSGKMRRLEYSAYRKTLFEKINSSPVRDHIEVFRGQFPQQTFDTIIASSDIMVFPYSEGAQSGVMAHAFAFGKPIVTSDLPAFQAAIRDSGAGFFAATDDEYVEKMVRLLSDGDVYKECSRNARQYVSEKISWKIVAEQTFDVYKKFDQKLECRTRYIYVG